MFRHCTSHYHHRFLCSSIVKSTPILFSNNPYLQNLAKMANNSSSKSKIVQQASSNDHHHLAINDEGKENKYSTTSVSLSLSDLYWPEKIRLSGKVFAPDSSSPLMMNPSSSLSAVQLETPQTGDIRIRRHYYARDAASEHADNLGFTKRIDPRSSSINKKKNPQDHIILENMNYFSDQSAGQKSFLLQSSRHIHEQNRNRYFEEANPYFSSLDEMGSRYHQLDGHELVEMQKTGRFTLGSAPAGSYLIDVWIQPFVVANGNNKSENKKKDKKTDDDDVFDAGFWVKFNNVQQCLGVQDFSFVSFEGALSLQQRTVEFLKSCQGVPSVFKSGRKKSMNPHKRFSSSSLSLAEANKNVSYAMVLESVEKSKALDPSWWPHRYRK